MTYQIKPVELPSDLNSNWFHPDIAQHDTISEDAEYYTKEQWELLQKNLGVEISCERWDYMDIPEIPEEDSSDWSNWHPKSTDQDKFLIAAFDTEDGPILWWAKPKNLSNEKLWAVNIPEEPDSAEMLYPVPSKEVGEKLVERLKNEALQVFPKVGQCIADSITLEEWNGSSEEHTKYLSENQNWWDEETFMEPSHD